MRQTIRKILHKLGFHLWTYSGYKVPCSDGSYCIIGYRVCILCTPYVRQRWRSGWEGEGKSKWVDMSDEDKAMANPEITNYVFDENVKRDQDFSNYYKHIFTLKSGKQIEILTQKSYDEIVELDDDAFIRIEGFILTPLVTKKKLKIKFIEIAAREEIKEPCIVHTVPLPKEVPVEGEDFLGIRNEHPINCNCKKCLPEKPLVEHKPECAVHNNPDRAGFSSLVSDCDCGAVILTQGDETDGKSMAGFTEHGGLS